jgi:predicted metalloprotease
VEDVRRSGGKGLAIGGGIGSVIFVVAYLLLGGDPQALVDTMQKQEQGAAPSSQVEGGDAPRDELSQFVGVVLADTEDAWNELFRQMGREYEEPKLVLFANQTRSGCGHAGAATGPFYCPADRKVYIDLSFYRTLHERFGAPGDFAQAYVIAHEVGHHVQNLLGISDRVQAARGQVARRNTTGSRFASSCRPTSSPASGPTTLIARSGSWNRRHRGSSARRECDRRR